MTLPGVDVRPLRLLTGDSHFNEVFLTEVRIADAMRLGEEGRGWDSALLRERRRQGGVPGADGSIEKLYHSEHRQRVQELLIDMGGEDAVAYPPGDT